MAKKPDQLDIVRTIIEKATEKLPAQYLFPLFLIILVLVFMVPAGYPEEYVMGAVVLFGLGGLVAAHFWRRDSTNRQPSAAEPLAPVPTPAPKETHSQPREQLQEQYLRYLWRQTEFVRTTTFKSATGNEATEIELSAVFTPLDVHVAPRTNDERPEAGLDMDDSERRVSFLEAVSDNQRLVLLGDPGSGKSTLVDFISLCLAGAWLGEKDVNLDRLGEHWKLGLLLPVRVILRDYAARGLARGVGLWPFIQEELAREETADGSTLADCASFVEETLHRPRGALLLLDGIDEVPTSADQRRALKHQVELFADHFKHCHILVTSRPYAYQDPGQRINHFPFLTLKDFSREQTKDFVSAWYTHLGAKDASLGPTRAARYAERLANALDNNKRLRDLAANPLLAALTAWLHRQREGGALPNKRHQLYEESVRHLLDLWQRAKRRDDDSDEVDVFTELGVSVQGLRRALEAVAYEAHRDQPENEQKTHDIPYVSLAGQIALAARDEGSEPGIERIVEYLRDRTGILIEREQGTVYRFPHRTFQEYLAACHLIGRKGPQELYRHLCQDTTRWREVALLAAGRIFEQTEFVFWAMLRLFCPAKTSAASRDGEWYAIVTAAEALIENGQHVVVDDDYDELRSDIRDGLTEIVKRADILSGNHADRAAAGRCLGLLGDPRPGVGLTQSGLPDISWCPVMAGTVTLKDDAGHFQVDPFHIAKYPITHLQYRTFIDAEDGYRNRTWWDGLAAREDTPGEQTWPIDNHPAENVSWYDALAFCRWLSTRTGYEVCLPTEWEWQQAASGGDSREFPWGADWEQDNANTSESGVGRTTAVGLYPAGVSSLGPMDMAGNVFEWCANRYINPGETDLSGDDSRVLRGGSWFSPLDFARCASRILSLSHSRDYFIGFRVVCSSPIR